MRMWISGITYSEVETTLEKVLDSPTRTVICVETEEQEDLVRGMLLLHGKNWYVVLSPPNEKLHHSYAPVACTWRLPRA